MIKRKREVPLVTVSIKVPEDERLRLKNLAYSSGKTVSQLVAEIIHSALSEGSGLNERLENIEKKVSAILDKLEDLSKECIQLDSGLERCDLLGLNKETREKPKKVKRKKK